MTDPNLSLVLDELAHAKEKHPEFVNSFAVRVMPWLADEDLKLSRIVLRGATQLGSVTFADVLQCELDEAFQAYAHGDLAHARQELAQCAAVCIRGMEYIEGKIDKKQKQENDK